MEEQWKHSSRALLKVRLTSFIGHCRAEWSFSMQLCSRICWFEDNHIDSIDWRKSMEHERGDVTLWKFNENTQYFFCIATQLQFRCSSINADLSNAEWLKYHWSNLYRDVTQPWPWQNSPCTCRLQGILKMSSTRGLPLEPYRWRQYSSVDSSPGRCRCRAVSSWQSVSRCNTASTMTEQSLYVSTTRHPQNVKYKRSTPGALPLASIFKCGFVARTMSLSSCEQLAGAVRQEATSGEPSSCQHKNKLIGSRPSVPCFCNESLLSNSSAPAGCRRAGRAQAGTKQLHPT